MPAPDPLPINIFLSYSSENRRQAEQLVTALVSRGCVVWWDGLLEGGERYANSIEKALEAATAVVVLWSRAATESHWVRDEATRGRERNCLVPVTLDDTLAPLGFRQFQIIDLSRWRGKQDAAEIDAIERAIRSLHGSAASALGRRPIAPAVSLTRRNWLLGGGAVGATALGGAGWFWWHSSRPARGSISANSVAVLPFVNLSSDAAQSYFSDGLTAEIRGSLTRNNALRVISQVSSDAVRDQRGNASQIADSLGVAFLLNGSVQRAGDTVRIATELVEGHSGISRWAQTFDRPITNIFAVQSEIAAAVGNALNSALPAAGISAAPAAAADAGGTANVAAFDAYLRGRAFYDLSQNEASDRAALAQFDAAIALDPGYAAAHSARARTLLVRANQYASAEQAARMYDAAVESATTATRLAPNFADAQSTLGFVLFQGRLDIRGARAAYEQSLRSGGGDATVLGRYALYSALTGHAAQAAESMTRAVQLDPLNPLIHRSMASVLYAARRYRDMAAPLQRALQLNAKLSAAHAALGNMFLQTGRAADALREFQREPQALRRLTGLAITEKKLNHADQADKYWQQLVKDLGDGALYQQAQVQTQWGNSDQAIAILERAKASGDSGLIYARNDPLLDPLRIRPAFQRLLVQLGFE